LLFGKEVSALYNSAVSDGPGEVVLSRIGGKRLYIDLVGDDPGDWRTSFPGVAMSISTLTGGLGEVAGDERVRE
jgi:hypothetical protein